jgi:hypothetical protein
MAYFNELPNIQYLSRFADQSSNEDYTLAKNIFRRARLREDVADAVTAFHYYQIKDDERPDQIAERIYGDPELDWVVLISNNITNYPSQWTLSNDSFYEYLIDKYGSEEAFEDVTYLQTKEVRDEYDRLVVPAKLKVDADLYQEFNTGNGDLQIFNLKTFPVPSEYYPLTINVNLGQYLEVWERDNQGEGQTYTGEEYQIADIKLQKREDPILNNFRYYPEYSRLDYSNLFVYGRNEVKNVFVLNTLNGWPNTWGGFLKIYNGETSIAEIKLQTNLGVPIDIAGDSRLYNIVAKEDPNTNTKLPEFKFIPIGEV